MGNSALNKEAKKQAQNLLNSALESTENFFQAIIQVDEMLDKVDNLVVLDFTLS